jgi:hypothetical protein
MVRGQAFLQSKPIPLAFRELQLCDVISITIIIRYIEIIGVILIHKYIGLS